MFKYILFWFAVFACLLALFLRSEKKLNAKTLGASILFPTCLTVAAVFFPPTAGSNLAEIFGNWLRNFIMFTALIHFALQSTRWRSALSGLSFATILACLEFLG